MYIFRCVICFHFAPMTQTLRTKRKKENENKNKNKEQRKLC